MFAFIKKWFIKEKPSKELSAFERFELDLARKAFKPKFKYLHEKVFKLQMIIKRYPLETASKRSLKKVLEQQYSRYGMRKLIESYEGLDATVADKREMRIIKKDIEFLNMVNKKLY